MSKLSKLVKYLGATLSTKRFLRKVIFQKKNGQNKIFVRFSLIDQLRAKANKAIKRQQKFTSSRQVHETQKALHTNRSCHRKRLMFFYFLG